MIESNIGFLQPLIYLAMLLILLVLLLVLFYYVCGFLDIKRNDALTPEVLKKYFGGSGRTTWHLSPLNLFCDLFCFGNRYVYTMDDLPDDYQTELKEVLNNFDLQKDSLMAELKGKLAGKNKAMLFFKWYDKNIINSLNPPEFHKEYKFVKTIGVSVFSPGQSTSAHFGPLRATLRVLYNLNPQVDDGTYIQVGRHKHIWHRNPLFIFDDTLLHQSCNGSSELRYCAFIDIIRPTFARSFLQRFVELVQVVFVNFNKIFYKHWEFIS